jgi:hypothetical protein
MAIATKATKFGVGGVFYTCCIDGIMQAVRINKILPGAIIVDLIAIGINRPVIPFENKVIVSVNRSFFTHW